MIKAVLMAERDGAATTLPGKGGIDICNLRGVRSDAVPQSIYVIKRPYTTWSHITSILGSGSQLAEGYY
jgi:hypothetical protein